MKMRLDTSALLFHCYVNYTVCMHLKGTMREPFKCTFINLLLLLFFIYETTWFNKYLFNIFLVIFECNLLNIFCSYFVHCL